MSESSLWNLQQSHSCTFVYSLLAEAACSSSPPHIGPFSVRQTLCARGVSGLASLGLALRLSPPALRLSPDPGQEQKTDVCLRAGAAADFHWRLVCGQLK